MSVSFFKPWVPEWLIRLTIFLVLIPALGIFALYFSNGAETIGYYGIEPADMQYSVVLMYALLVAILPIDDRLSKYLKPRTYFLTGVAINTLTYFICASSRNVTVFMVCRFIQGLSCAAFCSISLHMIFSRLRSDRARVIGYSVFYGTLQVSIPACALFCSWILHYFEFNHLFYFLVLAEVPGVVLMLIVTNHVRFRKKIPLYQLDWASFILYATMLCLTGYILVYGQQLNWFSSPQLRWFLLLTLGSGFFFCLRQYALKRPLIELRLFRFSGFRNGLLLLMAYYFFKGTTGNVYAYMQGILLVDPVHLTPVWLCNIAGIVMGMLVASRMVLNQTGTRWILGSGFLFLLVFHVWMYFLFSRVANTHQFLLPMWIQGFGTGALFVPIVMYVVSSVPTAMAGTVSFIGIAARFMGLCGGLAFANYFQLYAKSIHYNKFREQFTDINPMRDDMTEQFRQHFLARGSDMATARQLAESATRQLMQEQTMLRASMDYYTWMIVGLSILITVIVAGPWIKQQVLRPRRAFTPY
ncbi:MFS transporter [Chitinophaga qingshengii]|uniref:MFS transporter n=1 Tax=Chitinophaga qingshengii TaxID=1569794 RepID=A0ABR7TU90_9BACT|nr:MFS transporter [Chitinophaga qingshengii]MBC9933177.1 MFS transporter [Chitinophaga qingshengii]